MKHCLFAILASLSILMTYSCGDDNYDIYTEEEFPYEATEVYIDDALTFGLRDDQSLVNTAGIAHVKGTFYHVGSQDIDVVCGNELSYTFNGSGDYFSFTFFGNSTGSARAFGGFTTEIDGEPTSLTDVLYPDHCINDSPITVDYTTTDDRIRGTITGEFFTFVDSIVLPFDSCVNYMSLGILEASFDVELIVCD